MGDVDDVARLISDGVHLGAHDAQAQILERAHDVHQQPRSIGGFDLELGVVPLRGALDAGLHLLLHLTQDPLAPRARRRLGLNVLGGFRVKRHHVGQDCLTNLLQALALGHLLTVFAIDHVKFRRLRRIPGHLHVPLVDVQAEVFQRRDGVEQLAEVVSERHLHHRGERIALVIYDHDRHRFLRSHGRAARARLRRSSRASARRRRRVRRRRPRRPARRRRVRVARQSHRHRLVRSLRHRARVSLFPLPRSVSFVLEPRRSSAFYSSSPRRPSSSRARPRAPRARDGSSVARLRARASRRSRARVVYARDVESSNRVLGATRRRRRVVADRRRRLESIARSAPRPRHRDRRAVVARRSAFPWTPRDRARVANRRESRSNAPHRSHRVVARVAPCRPSDGFDATRRRWRIRTYGCGHTV